MPLGRPPNTDRDAEIVRMFEDDPNLSDSTVAFLFGMTRPRVQQIRLEAGVVRPRGMHRGAHPFLRRDRERNREIASRYAAGELSGDLAREFGVSSERVRQIVKAAGVALRRRGTSRKPDPAEAIL